LPAARKRKHRPPGIGSLCAASAIGTLRT
jgi:hypothetical protein